MQTLVAYVENKPGVLNRVSSLARRLAINIDSLTVGPTENEEIARMTIVAHTDEKGAHRLEASLEKLVDVLLAENISNRSVLERDLALIKVLADQKNRPHLMELIKVFRARVVDVAPESLILEVSGTVDKIDGLLEVLRPFGVLEMARTGRIAMTRGGDLLRPPVVRRTRSFCKSRDACRNNGHELTNAFSIFVNLLSTSNLSRLRRPPKEKPWQNSITTIPQTYHSFRQKK